MGKVYEAAKMVLDKNCPEQEKTMCSGQSKHKGIHIVDICWICKRNQPQALEIEKYAQD